MGIRSECLKKVGKRVSVAVVFPIDRSGFPAVGTKHGICSNCEKWWRVNKRQRRWALVNQYLWEMAMYVAAALSVYIHALIYFSFYHVMTPFIQIWCLKVYRSFYMPGRHWFYYRHLSQVCILDLDIFSYLTIWDSLSIDLFQLPWRYINNGTVDLWSTWVRFCHCTQTSQISTLY